MRVAFALLAAPTLAARVKYQNAGESATQTFSHLSVEDSLAANEALDILAQLKAGSEDVALQQKFKAAIGEIAWEEDRHFLASGMNSATSPPMLGEPSVPNSPAAVQTLCELLQARLGTLSWFTARVGRLFTGRRDFAVEGLVGETGGTKYMIDGITRSLHSRMQVSYPNDPSPRFVVRRAFSYLNPIATTAGQYVYRIIQCEEPEEGAWKWSEGCAEGEVLYTVTKDRFGRGALWGQDEYRVYTGTGGCRRHGYGLLACDAEYQIMYSLSTGLSSGAHDTIFYKGNIDAIDGDGQAGRLFDGTELDANGLENMQVASVSKAFGSPRALNWPIEVTHHTHQAAVLSTFPLARQVARTLTDTQLEILSEGEHGVNVLERLIAAAPAGQAELLGLTVQAGQIASSAGNMAFVLAWSYHLAKSLVWADDYAVVFDGEGGSTDDLLVHLVAAIQDLTREVTTIQPIR